VGLHGFIVAQQNCAHYRFVFDYGQAIRRIALIAMQQSFFPCKTNGLQLSYVVFAAIQQPLLLLPFALTTKLRRLKNNSQENNKGEKHGSSKNYSYGRNSSSGCLCVLDDV